VWRLQRGTDPECRFFQHFADAAHYRGKGSTRQGIYVITPGGKLLASCNSLKSEHVQDLMNKTLATWESLSPAQRLEGDAPDMNKIVRWEDSCPDDGLVLTSVNRDLPDDGQPSSPARSPWNRDHAWFSRQEARMFLPHKIEVGARVNLPDVLAQRFGQFHLVDNVKGQTLPYAPAEIRMATFVSEITAIDGDRVSITLVGQTDAESDGTWKLGPNDWTHERPYPRGIATSVLGKAIYDLAKERFEEFDMVAIGQRWGHTQNNARRKQREKSGVGFVFTLTKPGASANIAPAFIDIYNAEWIIRP
jgi:hypothetical protein